MKTIRDIYNENAAEYIAFVGDEIQTYEIPALEKFRQLLPDKATVLDIGCGSGKHAHWLQEHGCKVIALDVSDEMIAYAHEHFPGLDARRGTLQDAPLSTFDGIWCMRVFHHVAIAEQDAFLDGICNRLNTGGYLYITAVHDDHEYEMHDSVNGALKKRLTKERMHELLEQRSLMILESHDWGNGHSEYFCVKK